MNSLIVDQSEGTPPKKWSFALGMAPLIKKPKGELSSRVDSMRGKKSIIPYSVFLDLVNKNTLHFVATEFTSTYVHVYVCMYEM